MVLFEFLCFFNSTLHKEEGEGSTTQAKQVAARDSEDVERHQPKEEGEMHLSLGSVVFPCTIWALLLFPSSLECVASPLLFPYWMVLLHHLLLMGGAVVLLSPPLECVPPSPFYVCVHCELIL